MRAKVVDGQKFSLPCFLVLAATFTCPPVSADEPGWRLKCTMPSAGDLIVQFSASGVKNYFPKAGYVQVSAAPDWEPFLYNPSTKVYYRTTIDNLSKQLVPFHNFEGENIDSTRWVKTKSESEYLGHKIAKYRYNPLPNGAITKGEVWIAQDIDVPQRYVRNVMALYRTPNVMHPAIKVVCGTKSKQIVMIETSEITKTTIPQGLYDLPKGYKPVKSFMEVVMGSYVDDIKDMADNLGTTLNSSKSKSK